MCFPPELLCFSRRKPFTATKIPFMYSFSRNCVALVPIFTFMCCGFFSLYNFTLNWIFSIGFSLFSVSLNLMSHWTFLFVLILCSWLDFKQNSIGVPTSYYFLLNWHKCTSKFPDFKLIPMVPPTGYSYEEHCQFIFKLTHVIFNLLWSNFQHYSIQLYI